MYFYFFPRYPDYNISESYFETRFQKEWFQSEKNGFHEWKKLVESLNQHEEIITEFDTYYKCYFENTCLKNFEDLSEIQKQEELKKILENQEKMQEFWEITNNFLKQFEEITQKYEFISTLNYANEENWQFAVASETIVLTKLISFSRGILFYSNYSWDKVFTQNMTQLYKNIAWLSKKLDDGVIGYLVIINISNAQFDYLKSNVEDLSPLVKKILFTTMKENPISNDMIQNGIRAEHQYGNLIIHNLFSWALNEVNKQTWKNIKTILFFDRNDSLNLMKKIDYNKVEWICEEFNVKINWKNWIWRTLAQSWWMCMQAQYKKQSYLLQKREEVLQLLSN